MSALPHKPRISPAYDGQMFILQKHMVCSIFVDWNKFSTTAKAQLPPIPNMVA
jgi:hypothetical protein